MPRFAGNKVSRKHTSIITKGTVSLARKIVREPKVKKLALGRITPQAGGTSTGLSFKAMNGGIKIIVRDGGKKQEFTVFTVSQEGTREVQSKVEKFFK